MQGHTHIPSDAAWLGLSDVVWQWFKPLNPWQVNAVKSLVSLDALADEAHPLRSRATDPGRLELFVAIFPGGRARLMMSLRQLEYLQYYIKAMKLIRPTPEAIERYRTRLREVHAAKAAEQETGSQALSDDGDDEGKQKSDGGDDDWDIDVATLDRVPLPSSKYYVLRDDVIDIVPVHIRTDEDLKRTMKNPRPWYETAKGLRTTPIEDSISGSGSIRPATPATPLQPTENANEAEEAGDASVHSPFCEEKLETATHSAESTQGNGVTSDQVEEKNVFDGESGPGKVFQRAEQIYIAASQSPDSTITSSQLEAVQRSVPRPAAFLTIDFQAWEEEHGVILDVGWSGCWFAKDDQDGSGEDRWAEQRDGGHWIIKENAHRLNKFMKCSVDGKITRMPYVGTGESEILPWEQVLPKVKALVPMMQKKCNGGSVFVIVHSTDADVHSLSRLGLDVSAWNPDIEASASAAEIQVFVIDTSEMLAAVTNASNGKRETESKPLARSRCTLERLADLLLKDHPVLHHVTGNSGNIADAKMECFLVMVIRGLAKTYLAIGEESVEPQQNEADTVDWADDKDVIEALARQDDADRTILLHEQARRQREILLRTGLEDHSTGYDSQEDEYDSEEDDRKLLEEFEMEYDIGAGGPEDGIEDD